MRSPKREKGWTSIAGESLRVTAKKSSGVIESMAHLSGSGWPGHWQPQLRGPAATLTRQAAVAGRHRVRIGSVLEASGRFGRGSEEADSAEGVVGPSDGGGDAVPEEDGGSTGLTVVHLQPGSPLLGRLCCSRVDWGRGLDECRAIDRDQLDEIDLYSGCRALLHYLPMAAYQIAALRRAGLTVDLFVDPGVDSDLAERWVPVVVVAPGVQDWCATRIEFGHLNISHAVGTGHHQPYPPDRGGRHEHHVWSLGVR